MTLQDKYKTILIRRYKRELAALKLMVDREFETINEGSEYTLNRALPNCMLEVADTANQIKALENLALYQQNEGEK